MNTRADKHTNLAVMILLEFDSNYLLFLAGTLEYIRWLTKYLKGLKTGDLKSFGVSFHYTPTILSPWRKPHLCVFIICNNN